MPLWTEVYVQMSRCDQKRFRTYLSGTSLIALHNAKFAAAAVCSHKVEPPGAKKVYHADNRGGLIRVREKMAEIADPIVWEVVPQPTHAASPHECDA